MKVVEFIAYLSSTLTFDRYLVRLSLGCVLSDPRLQCVCILMEIVSILEAVLCLAQL